MPERPLKIDDYDQDVLKKRGVSLQTARSNRLRTENGDLVIPFGDIDGNYNCYFVRRPHDPRIVDGKPLKYIAPTGKPSRLYIPAEARGTLRDASTRIIVTEGPIKALALTEQGFPAVGLLGVFNWKQKRTDELIPDIAAIPLTGRSVYIVYDFDPKPTTRQYVDTAKRRFARRSA